MLPAAMVAMIVYALSQSIAPNLFAQNTEQPEINIEDYAEMYDVNITCICKPFESFKPKEMRSE